MVISIIAILIGVLLPALASARREARFTTCGSNLRQVGIAIHTYAQDFGQQIPQGPAGAAPPFYYRPYMATNMVWTPPAGPLPGSRVGLGLALSPYLTDERAIFCPGDDTADPVDELANIQAQGGTPAFCSYLYRHRESTTAGKLDDLGVNSAGRRASAWALDQNYLLPSPGVRTNHDNKKSNLLFKDGHVRGFMNEDNAFAIDDFNIDAELDAIFVAADTKD